MLQFEAVSMGTMSSFLLFQVKTGKSESLSFLLKLKSSKPHQRSSNPISLVVKIQTRHFSKSLIFWQRDKFTIGKWMAQLHSAFVYNCSWIQHLKFVQTAGSDDHVTGAVVWLSLMKTLFMTNDTVTKFCVMKLQKSSPLVPFGTFYDILEWYNRTVPMQKESKLQGFVSPDTLFSWIDASRICRQSGMNLMYFTNMEHLAKMLFYEYKDPDQSVQLQKLCNVTQVEAIFVQGFGQKVFKRMFFIYFLHLLFHTCGVNVFAWENRVVFLAWNGQAAIWGNRRLKENPKQKQKTMGPLLHTQLLHEFWEICCFGCQWDLVGSIFAPEVSITNVCIVFSLSSTVKNFHLLQSPLRGHVGSDKTCDIQWFMTICRTRLCFVLHLYK